MKYKQKESGLYIVIDADLMRDLLAQAQLEYPNENGGMLAGNYSADTHTLYVRQSVNPKEKTSTSISFERKTEGMEDVWAQLAEQGLRYVGEWHSHPNGSPQCSATDLAAMTGVEKEVSIENPILLIIGSCRSDTFAHRFYVYRQHQLMPYMPMIDLKDMFAGLQQQMLASLVVDRGFISHEGSKGDATEHRWIEFLRAYLPNRYKVDKAIVIDSDGNVSNQMDIVVYDSLYTPFIFNQDGSLYIPAESVYAVFEVKQDINGHIDYAGKKIASVRQLKRTSIGMVSSGMQMKARMLTKIVGGILTTTNSYKKEQTIRDNLSALKGFETIDLGCCCDYGSFFVDYTENEPPNPRETDFSNGELNRQIIADIYESRVVKEIKFSDKNTSLFTFFLQIVNYLKVIGTVPAIDMNAYLRQINERIDSDI